MAKAVCCNCIEDPHLSELIKEEGEKLRCTSCDESHHAAITIERLGQLMEPIMRQHYQLGEDVRTNGEDDKDYWEQEGEPMSDAVQTILGQYFGFENEIVDAIIDAEDCWPPSGDIPYWDSTNMYVPKRVQTAHYFEEWHYTLAELKHGRRFFSPAAQALFGRLFQGIEELQASTRRDRPAPVVRLVPTGKKIFRARVCSSRSQLKEIYSDPMKHVGPPPAEHARAGRMNAEGVTVLYGAEDVETCLAEMRPALGSEVVVIGLETTQPLRLLDFSRLEKARSGSAISYFQTDFTEQVERRTFLRRLHSLVSKPIVPGHEADYLITQTMGEYLAYVHDQPVDGIIFSSVQRAGGMNIVLFAQRDLWVDKPEEPFRVKYLADSIDLVSMTAISYTHHRLEVKTGEDGEPWVWDNRWLAPADDWE
jgi:hypothetical protein